MNRTLIKIESDDYILEEIIQNKGRNVQVNPPKTDTNLDKDRFIYYNRVKLP